jgi:predicted site-specific integrase-resolvase
MHSTPNIRRKLRATDLAARYGADPRTIYRWRKTGVLPPPDFIINGAPFWSEEVIETNERERLSAQAVRPSPDAA